MAFNEGFEIAIDDFGTSPQRAYLSGTYLDYLKIDRGFVNAIGTETSSPVLTRC